MGTGLSSPCGNWAKGYRYKGLYELKSSLFPKDRYESNWGSSQGQLNI